MFERRMIIIAVPIISSFSAIDATLSNDVTFSYSGSQVYGNQIQIFRNSDGTKIYDNSVTSFLLKHTIPAGTLTNGIQYYIQLRVWDKNTTYSSFSSSQIFTCHLTPNISINITQSQVIQASNYEVDLTYRSTDNEILNTWILYLYDTNGNLITNTDIQYAANTMKYTLTALESSTQYKIKVTGNTVDNMTISTALITFSVQYNQLSTFFNVELENQSDTGLIRVKSNLVSITGTSNPSPPTYINNQEVDLTASGSYVIFDSGFSVNGDFSRQVILRKITPYVVAYTMTNGTDIITVKYMKAIFDNSIGYQGYFLLEVTNPITVYRIATPQFALLSDTQQVIILIQRINNLYNLTYELKS